MENLRNVNDNTILVLSYWQSFPLICALDQFLEDVVKG